MIIIYTFCIGKCTFGDITVELCEKYLKLYAEDAVLDLFGGSGSTLIAAEKLGLKCKMIEHNPRMCDVIRKRWTKWAQENGRKVGSGGLE